MFETPEKRCAKHAKNHNTMKTFIFFVASAYAAMMTGKVPATLALIAVGGY
jgi:uncharacterized MAPEG superfamily protein